MYKRREYPQGMTPEEIKAANEADEVEWYKSCEKMGTTFLWKPIRSYIHTIYSNIIDVEDKLRQKTNFLTVGVIVSILMNVLMLTLLLKLL